VSRKGTGPESSFRMSGKLGAAEDQAIDVIAGGEALGDGEEAVAR